VVVPARVWLPISQLRAWHRHRQLHPITSVGKQHRGHSPDARSRQPSRYIIPYSCTQDAAPDPNDSATAWSVGNTEEDYTKFLKANGVQGKRIGVLRSFFGIAPINDEVNIIASQAVEDLKRSGATVVELNTPDLDSGKLSSDIGVHLYEFKPAINAYLAAGNTPDGTGFYVAIAGH
jgi:hypothetical protein